MQGRQVQVGRTAQAGVLKDPQCCHYRPYTLVTRPKQTLRDRNQRLGFRNSSTIKLTRQLEEVTPYCLHIEEIHQHIDEVHSLQQGAVSYYQGILSVEAVPQ